MAGHGISLTKDQPKGLFTNSEGLKGLVASAVNRIPAAERYQRSEAREVRAALQQHAACLRIPGLRP